MIFKYLHIDDRFTLTPTASHVSDRVYVKTSPTMLDGYMVNTALLINGKVEMYDPFCGPIFVKDDVDVTMYYPSVICKECQKKEDLRFFKEMNEKLIKDKLCFSCCFWNDWILNINNPSVVRIKNQDNSMEHYYIGAQDHNYTNKSFCGHGGRKFNIKFFDGRIVETTNLWSQGTIPERFHDRLLPNAEFIKGI